MTQATSGGAAGRRPARRGVPRRVSIRLLVVAAVVISATLMAGLTGMAVVARSSCLDHPTVVNLAVSTDIAPAVQRVAQYFNREHVLAAGHCAEVEVTEGAPVAQAAQIDGQAPGKGLPRIDAWIPDSSLWVDVARSFPAGAAAVQPTGTDVARSPLMIIMPPSLAAGFTEFRAPVSWRFLLPASDGGPPAALGLRVDIPDPTQSAAGLATLIEVSRALGTGPAARAALTRFVFSSEATSQFDNPISLASFVRLAAPPLNGHPVSVTTEQAVIGYDRAHPSQPIAARYPSGPTAALATPELDYPFVLTSPKPAVIAAAKKFEGVLRQRYAAGVLRYYGFRTDRDPASPWPASYGTAGRFQAATPAAPSEAQAALQAWRRLSLGSRDLVLSDVSGAMDAPAGVGGQTLEQVLSATSVLGLALFPDTTQMGLWQFADRMDGSKPYRQMIPVGPLPGALGLITRRQQMQQIDESTQPLRGRPSAMYATILAAYRYMLATYKPNYSNAVIVLTAGVDNARDDITLTHLLRTLRAIYDPNRRVEIVAVMLGTRGNFRALQEIAAATNGGAFQITDPTQVGRVFFEAIANRICAASCPGG
jgi:hypothetical protein